MARMAAPGSRDRILDNAARLFREHGVRAVGLQQVIDECGCGKNLLYREFASKDELIVAYLERCSVEWRATIDVATAPLADDPAGQILAIVRVAAAEVVAPGYRGCPFRNVRAEFPAPDHPAHQASVAEASAMRAHFLQLAERAGAPDPATLADRILLIIDGIYASGAAFGADGPVRAAVAFAEEVVAEATR